MTAITITITITGRDQAFITGSGSIMKVTIIIGDKVIIITTMAIIMVVGGITVVEVLMEEATVVEVLMVAVVMAAVVIIRECSKTLRLKKIDIFKSVCQTISSLDSPTPKQMLTK